MSNDARFKQQVANAIAKNRIRILSGSSTTYHSASFLTAESGTVTQFHSPILIPVASASAMPTPQEGTGSLYVKATDNKIYFKNDGGTEYNLTDTGGGGGGGAPTDAQYVTLAANGDLSNERILTAGNGMTLTDNGAGSTVVLTVTGSTDLGELTGSNLMIDGSTSGTINFVNDGRIYIKDNDSTALVISEANNAYMNFNTTNSSETIAFYKTARIRDDVKLTFGNGDDAHIEYNEDGDDFMIVSGSAQGIAMSGSFIKLKADNDEGVLIGGTTGVITQGLNASTPTLSFMGGNGATIVGIYGSDIDDNYDMLTMSGSYAKILFGVKDSANALQVGHQGNERILEVTAGGVVVNEGSNSACDFRVESDSETHMLFVDSGNSRVSIGDSTDAPAATLEITNHASAGATGAPLVQLNSNDTDEICLDIDAANIDADVIDITADAITTAFVMDVSADALTTGGILNLVSNSSDTNDRTLVKVTNDNTGASGTTIMHLKSDAVTDDNPILLIESSAADTGPVLELRNTNAGTNREAILRFTRSDSSAEADDMDLGRLQFEGVDSGNNDTIYVAILAEASDVTSGDEGGLLKFRLFSGGTGGTASSNTLFSIGGEDVANSTPCEVVVNEDGIDCNFRAESDNNTHMLFVDAGDDTVTVGADDSLHKDGFAVINDYQSTTFENKLADGEYGSGEILKYSPGSNDLLTSGQLYYLKANGTWGQTDADSASTGGSQLLGVGLGGSSRTVGCLIRGFIKIPSTEILNTPGSVDGKPLYVSTTAGHFDFNAPSGTGDFVRVVGYAIDDDSGDVLVYFNPDGTFVEIA